MRSKVSVNKGMGKAPAPKREKYRKVDRSKKLAAKTRLRLNQMKTFRTKTKIQKREQTPNEGSDVETSKTTQQMDEKIREIGRSQSCHRH